MQPIIEPLSCTKFFTQGDNDCMVTEVCEFARNLIVLINDDAAYDEARSQAELVRERVRSLEIRLRPSARRHCPPPTAAAESPGRVQYNGLTRSPQGNRDGPLYADDLTSDDSESPNPHMDSLDD
jgi:hypothetical protein